MQNTDPDLVPGIYITGIGCFSMIVDILCCRESSQIIASAKYLWSRHMEKRKLGQLEY